MAADIFSRKQAQRLRIIAIGAAMAASVLAAWWVYQGRHLVMDWLEARELARMEQAERAATLTEHLAFTDLAAPRRSMTVEIGPGESLPIALARLGAPWREIEAAVAAMEPAFDPARVRPGDPVQVTFETLDGAIRILGVALFGRPGEAVTVSRLFDGEFSVLQIETPVAEEVAHVSAKIDGSLYETAVGAGATGREVNLIADVFSYDLDLQRDLRPGDGLELVFERSYDSLGRTVQTGDLLFAALDTRRARKGFYRFQAPGQAQPEWFDADGRSARKFLMRTPINGARLSSSFGMRRHPVLGYSKMHRGTDFAAPTGTPIFAAGDGVVERAGWFGAYGRYVRIRHDRTYQTAYAHMSGFARGLREGARVAQGQVIGYVGTTGRSTGPHLHYEVLQNGAQVNPMSIQATQTVELKGDALEAFKAERARIDAIRGVEPGEAALVALRGEATVR